MFTVMIVERSAGVCAVFGMSIVRHRRICVVVAIKRLGHGSLTVVTLEQVLNVLQRDVCVDAGGDIDIPQLRHCQPLLPNIIREIPNEAKDCLADRQWQHGGLLEDWRRMTCAGRFDVFRHTSCESYANKDIGDDNISVRGRWQVAKRHKRCNRRRAIIVRRIDRKILTRRAKAPIPPKQRYFVVT